MFTSTSFHSSAPSIVQCLLKVIAKGSWSNLETLVELLRAEAKRLALENQDGEVIILNLNRRVLKLVRDEFHRFTTGAAVEDADNPHATLQKLLQTNEQNLATLSIANNDSSSPAVPGRSSPARLDPPGSTKEGRSELRTSLVETVKEWKEELECVQEELVQSANEHIQVGDRILTIGYSSTLAKLFLSVDRRFELLIAASAPFNTGERLAKELAGKKNIRISVIADEEVYAQASQLSKVIVGSRLVFADGSCMGPIGMRNVALAAKHFVVPFLIVTPSYKLSPIMCTQDDSDQYNDITAPLGLVPFGVAKEGEDVALQQFSAHIYSPRYDYIPCDLISLYVTNVTTSDPDFVYKMLQDMYHPADVEKS